MQGHSRSIVVAIRGEKISIDGLEDSCVKEEFVAPSQRLKRLCATQDRALQLNLDLSIAKKL